MKYKPDKRQISWGLTIFITITLCILVACFVLNLGYISKALGSMMNSIAPILYGVVIGFLLNPILNLLERKWLAPHYAKKGIDISLPENRKYKNLIRGISVAICVILLIGIIVAIVMIVVPQLILSIQTIINNFSTYIQNVNRFFEDLAGEDPEMQAQIMGMVSSAEAAISDWYDNNIAANISEIISEVTSAVVSFGKFIWNFIIGVIVAIYLLYTKDTLRGQAKKLVYSLFQDRWANEIIGAFRYVDITFIGFLTGKLLDSLIIGILSFIIMNIVGTPFPALVAVILGITNIVPFFGPWIGFAIGGILVFMISPVDCLWFTIMCLALQIFDGYILGPKILGDSTGLSNFWVIFAIMFFGGVWGFVGWIVGVPLFACLYEFAKRIVNHLIRKKNLADSSSEHMQKVAYYEDGEEYDLGDPEADKYYAARTKSNAWARALGVEKRSRNRNTSPKKEEESGSKEGAGER